MTKRVPLSAEQIRQVEDLWEREATHFEIAQAIGITMDSFRLRLKDDLAFLPKRDPRAASGRRGLCPTPAEIEEACRLLRESWTPEQLAKR